MQLTTLVPKTPAQLYARLTQTEKIALRGANTDDRLEYLRTRAFFTDGPLTIEGLREVQELCNQELRESRITQFWY